MIVCLALLLLMAGGVYAQGTAAADSLQVVSADTLASAPDIGDSLQERIWKQRAKYLHLVYGIQKVESNFKSLDCDMAFALVWGRTYYLHKKPLAGMLKFGIDWSFLDVNFAKYPDLDSSPEVSAAAEAEGPLDLSIMQLEAGMGIGPSLTINPVDHFKAAIYFHVTPSYSMMMQDGSFYHHYATFFNAGLSLAYKVVTIGVEQRWCGKTDYNGITLGRLDDIYDSQGNFHDPFQSMGAKMKTRTLRLYVGFRF